MKLTGARRTHDNIREFGNGYINIRFTQQDIEDAKKDELLVLSEVLGSADCYFIGETFCLSNWTTGHEIYNAYSNLTYIFDWSDLDKLKAGKTVKLYARDVDEAALEWIAAM